VGLSELGSTLSVSNTTHHHHRQLGKASVHLNVDDPVDLEDPRRPAEKYRYFTFNHSRGTVWL